MEILDNKRVEVCSECKRASCWYGEFMCEYARNADTIVLTAGELRELNLENEEYWSDKKMLDVYGFSAPQGYK